LREAETQICKRNQKTYFVSLICNSPEETPSKDILKQVLDDIFTLCNDLQVKQLGIIDIGNFKKKISTQYIE